MHPWDMGVHRDMGVHQEEWEAILPWIRMDIPRLLPFTLVLLMLPILEPEDRPAWLELHRVDILLA